MCWREYGDPQRFNKILLASNMKGILELEWRRNNLYGEVETEFTYLSDRMKVGGGCEAAVAARTQCGCVLVTELLA